MDIRGLSQIGIDVADLEAWIDYAQALGGIVSRVRPDTVRVKLDDRPYRLELRAGDGREGLAFVAWDVADSAALDDACTELEAAGHAVEIAPPAECVRRQVRGLVRTTDPDGTSVELIHGHVLDHVPFVSPVGIGGFVTGELGLGHVVLGTASYEETRAFYLDLLGFRISDVMRYGDRDIVFARCNPRHHSLALVPADTPALYHFMLEVDSIDDVGRTLSHHRSHGIPVSMDVGRHTNDGMFSFYSRSPSGFDVEFGCQGILVDEATWTVDEITSASVWGHERQPTT